MWICPPPPHPEFCAGGYLTTLSKHLKRLVDFSQNLVLLVTWCFLLRSIIIYVKYFLRIWFYRYRSGIIVSNISKALWLRFQRSVLLLQELAFLLVLFQLLHSEYHSFLHRRIFFIFCSTRSTTIHQKSVAKKQHIFSIFKTKGRKP